MSIKNNSGSALLMVIIFVLVLIILGTAMLSATITEYRMEKAYRDSVKAYYLAEAGLEKVIYSIAEMDEIVPEELLNKTWEMEREDRDLLNPGEEGDFTVVVEEIILVDTVYKEKKDGKKEGKKEGKGKKEVYKSIYEVVLKSSATVEGMTKEVELKAEVEDYREEGKDNKVEVIYWRQVR